MSLKKGWWAAGVIGIGLCAGHPVVQAEEKAADHPPSAQRAEPGPKLWGVWAKLTSLTPDQKLKMRQIHDNALAEKRKIDQQEEIDLLAVLSDEQKQELQRIKESISAAKKAKEAEKAQSPTDKPAE